MSGWDVYESLIPTAPIKQQASASRIVRPRANTAPHFDSINDAALIDFMSGGMTAAGIAVNNRKAMYNTALLRCVTLISTVIGMLPLNIFEQGSDKAIAKKHPLYRLLKHKPNDWQTAYEFKSYMQLKVLQYGNAYARIIRSRGRVIMLVPLCPTRIEVKQSDRDWSLSYTYTRNDGSKSVLDQDDILHLRDLSDDGIKGMSRVEKAKEALGLALQAQQAAGNTFKSGMMAGGALSTDGELSDESYARLRQQVDEKSGAAHANEMLILESGLKAQIWSNTAKDAQQIENRNHQIEEIGRVFGIPRPLLMMDDTSWGSGIEQLAIFLVQYGMQPYFTMWEQALSRDLLTDDEFDKHYFKFNERALMRGTLKDQADYFTKALGSGGHMPWMCANEVRDLTDLNQKTDPRASELQQIGVPSEPNQAT